MDRKVAKIPMVGYTVCKDYHKYISINMIYEAKRIS